MLATAAGPAAARLTPAFSANLVYSIIASATAATAALLVLAAAPGASSCKIVEHLMIVNI